jgi:cell division protein FtsB
MRWMVALGFCIGILNVVAEDRGLPALLKARRQAREIEAGIAALRVENAALRARAAALRHDPRAIELVAREQLGLTRAGEIVVFRAPR